MCDYKILIKTRWKVTRVSHIVHHPTPYYNFLRGTASWLRIPPRRGYAFHRVVATHSTASWLRIPPRRGYAFRDHSLCLFVTANLRDPAFISEGFACV